MMVLYIHIILVPITRSNAIPTVMYDDPFNATRATGKHTLKALVIPFDFRRSWRSPCMMVLYIHNGRWKTVIGNKVNARFYTGMTYKIMISCIILYGSLLKNVKSQNARLISNCSNKFLDGGSNKTTKEAMLKIVPSIDAMLAKAPSKMIVQILASTGMPHVSGYILEMHSSSVVVFIGMVF